MGATGAAAAEAAPLLTPAVDEHPAEAERGAGADHSKDSGKDSGKGAEPDRGKGADPAAFWRVPAAAGPLLQCACCLAVFVGLLWLAAFVLMCLLLSWADEPAVHSACAGFWDFMLVSMLSPVLVPTAYCMTACLGLVSWRLFSGACMLVFGVSSLYMTLVAAGNHECVEALRATARGPVPWLIIVGWFKAAAYGAGALSTLWGGALSH